MTLQTYIKKLQEICDKYPKAEVIYSSDDEGNDYQEVFYDPSIGDWGER